jgi:hypothetical protein
MAQVNREFAEFLSQVVESQGRSKAAEKMLAADLSTVGQNSPVRKSKLQAILVTNSMKGGSK